MIYINVIYSFKEEEFHANFSESNDKLILEEKFSYKSPEGKSLWIISIPVKTKIAFKSATGNFSAEGVESDIQVETGTGFITMDEVNGDFNVSTGTGSIEIENIIINGSSKFTSGTGNVSVALAQNANEDISIVSGTGNAVLNYQGNPLTGCFKFGAIKDKGRIESPIKFEKESLEPNGNLYNEIKSFRINVKDEPRININTGTGLARLIK